MNDYDPLKTPDPEAWQALDEEERIILVEAYHEREGIDLPNAQVHATFHVMIENQLAAADPPEAPVALARLRKEGLDRHEALHAMSWALSKLMYEAIKNPSKKQQNVAENYIRSLKRLTAKKWLRSAGRG